MIHLQLKQDSTIHNDSKQNTQVLTLSFWKFSSISETANMKKTKHPVHKINQEGAQKRHKPVSFLLTHRPQWLLWRGLGYIFSVHPSPHQSPDRLSAVQLLCVCEVNSRSFSLQFLPPLSIMMSSRKTLKAMKVEILH